ncbi:MAG: hypothetical protein ACOH2M_17155 [Cypionkella sp.]
MTKLEKTKGKAGVKKPVLTDEQLYENGQAVGHIALSGDAAKDQTSGK